MNQQISLQYKLSKIIITLWNINVHQWILNLVGWLNGLLLKNVIGMDLYVHKSITVIIQHSVQLYFQ